MNPEGVHADGVVTGVEALLRWKHPEWGQIAPTTLVELAEQSDLIGEIGHWMLDRSCRDHRRWSRAHPGSHLNLAVNVSTRQLMNSGFAASVKGILASSGMDPHDLVLEVTENIVVADKTRAMVTLTELRDQGIRLALDDFGTGFSSLSYLRQLPINIVKIDRSFITDIALAPTGAAIVGAVTDLAHSLGLAVTAEGVETRSQHDEITAVGCDTAQGFFYARPMPASAMRARLRASGPSPLRLPGQPVATTLPDRAGIQV